MNSGIYKITNLKNGMVYIGQSINVCNRMCQHRSDLRGNRHNNDKLQKSWNKYGEDNFMFETIEICKKSQLNDREVYWINYYKSNTRYLGFNMDSGGNANKTVSEETKKKISENHADVSGENNPFYKKKHTDETIDKIKNSEGYKNRTEKIKGSGCWRATLTEEIVIQIKTKIKEGFSDNDIVSVFNCTLNQVRHIRHNRCWKHIIV